MYENLHGKNDTLYPTNMVVVIDKEYTVEVVDEDVKQMVVSTEEMLPLSNGQKGGLGGANKKQTPKSLFCEEPSCQFSMGQEDKVSAVRVLRNHMFVAHKKQEQIHQQEMCGRKRGRRRVASHQVLERRQRIEFNI
jgi:hypothetical protein